MEENLWHLSKKGERVMLFLIVATLLILTGLAIAVFLSTANDLESEKE